MIPDSTIHEVQRCARALTAALNEASEQGHKFDIEVVPVARAGDRCDLREVLVHQRSLDEGRKPEDLNSANDS